jgi:hypothetical protein
MLSSRIVEHLTKPLALSRLTYDIYFKTDLIEVTARQRVEPQIFNSHPCEDSPYYIL